MKLKISVPLAILFVNMSVQSQQQEVYTSKDPLREVDGQLYNVDLSAKWETKRCYFNEQFNQGALMSEIVKTVDHVAKQSPMPYMPDYRPVWKESAGQKILVKNFITDKPPTSGDTVEIRVMRAGQTNFNGEVLPVYDYGKIYHPPPPKPLTPEEIAAAKAKADATKKAGNEKALKYNQEQAKKGDPTGLLRMGERYRDGDGVPKDLAKARDYFTKAVAAGSPSAADELLKMNQNATTTKQ
jgi:hypothetical protein